MMYWRGTFMIFQNSNFKTLQSSLDALWIKQKVISNNIANYETPGFKASKVSFKDVLKKEIEDGVQKEFNILEVDIQKDLSLSSRLDGNNVDIEKEQLEMWETYAQYTYLSQNVSKQLRNMSYVINNTGK
jgi:flagellar basal-body rod protein FlgB